MERQSVKSSNIAAIGYDAESQAMEVEFKNGGIFLYSGVEPKQFTDLMVSDSIGKHFHSKIRSCHECRRVGND
jgi:hypothetical protein